ncbi:MAG: host attachment protein [Marinicaulis sp.]|nr:host attachment protein [Marinicaulis sp.]
MITPQRTTWFLVADGARMQLFESRGMKEQWTLIDNQEAEDARKASRELGRERPGRGHKTGPDSRFAMGGAEPHDKIEAAFLGEIAAKLNKAAQREKFDQIVVAAPPQALGKLRAKFQLQVTAKYIGVFDKDLTNMPEPELLDYFKERLGRW